MAIPMKITFTGINNLFYAVKSTNQLKNNISDINKITQNTGTIYESAFKKAEKFSYIDNIFGKINKKINTFYEKQDVFKKIGGRTGLFGKQLLTIGKNMEKLTGKTNGLGKTFEIFGGTIMSSSIEGKGLFSSLKSGFSGVNTAIKTGTITLTGLTASFETLASIALTTLTPIALIAAAIFTLKKIWNLNLGGIQSKFNAIMGQLKTAWAKFNIMFIKALKKLEPIFSAVFDFLYNNVKSTFLIISGIFKGIYFIIEPIINSFSELFKGLKTGKSDFSALASIGKILGNVFIYLGKTIGFMLKIVLKPLFFQIKIISKVFKILWDVLKAVVKTALIPLIINFNFLKNMFVNSISIMKNVWNFFVKSFEKSPLYKTIIKLKDIFSSTFNEIKNTISNLWDYIIGIINKIPNILLPKSLEGLKTEGNLNITNEKINNAPGVKANAYTGNNSIINNNQNIAFHTSTPTSPDQTRSFAQKLQQQLINGY